MKIDKNIPIPQKSSSGARKYPFHEMEVGDSFFISTTSPNDIPRIRAAANSYGKNNDKVFMTLTVDGGCRVWLKA